MIRLSTATSTTLARLMAFAIFPACGFSHQDQPPSGFDSCPASSSPSMPRALIGPDVDVRVLCGGAAVAPIASVDAVGAGATRWSFTVTGDSAFRPGTFQEPSGTASSFVVCQADSPQVAFVQCIPPVDAPPGSTFDAIATVHADDGSFADGTVKLHAEVSAPIVTVDKTNVDFGNVAPGESVTMPLRLTVENNEGVNLFLDPPPAATSMLDGVASSSYGPFVINGGMLQGSTSFGLHAFVWNVTFVSDAPGDYSETVGWRATPVPASCEADASCSAPTDDPSCDWTTTVTLHARVPGDGGVDAYPG
jgi:hypothetical protein